MALLKPKGKTVRKFLFIAAVGVTTSIFIQSPSAQNVDPASAAKAAMEKAVTEMGIQLRPSATAQDKADAAMTTTPSPNSEPDQRAAAAMSKTP
jgi:hypothetical protein